MSGFKSGALELRKKDSLPVNADPSNILIAVDTQNRLYTVDENGVYRYLSATGTSGTGSVTSVGVSSTTLNVLGSPITSAGIIDIELSATGVISGTYGNNINVAQITVDNFGRILSVSNVGIMGGAGGGSVSSVGVSSTTLTISNTPITTSGVMSVNLSSVGSSGTYTKTQVDKYGRITSGGFLTSVDIPLLNYLPLSGGTLSGPGNLNVSGNEIVAGTIKSSNFSTNDNSIFIGDSNSYLGSINILIGSQAGQFLTSASAGNIFVGQLAGLYTSSGVSNTFIGHQAGNRNTFGSYNSTFGRFSGISNTIGSANVFIGYEAGNNNISGNYNTYIGPLAGASQTSSNNLLILDAYGNRGSSVLELINSLIVGQADPSSSNQYISLNANTTVSQKLNVSGTTTLGTLTGILKGTSGVVSIATSSDFPNFSGLYLPLSGGTLSGPGNLNVSGTILASNFYTDNSGNVFAGNNISKSGASNTILGNYAGSMITSSSSGNLFIGQSAGFSNLSGSNNVFLGPQAGFFNTVANTNIFLGYQAGFFNISGNSNIYLGYGAGYSNLGKSNTFIGTQAGANQTSASNMLIIDSLDSGRSTSTLELTNSLIVGKSNSSLPQQTLSLNANTTVSQTFNVSGTTTLGNLNGILKGISGVVSIATSADIPVLPYLSAIPTLNYGSVSSVGLSSTTLSIGLSPVTTSGNISVNLSGVGISGVYTKVQTDTFGRVISGTNLTSADIPVLPYLSGSYLPLSGGTLSGPGNLNVSGTLRVKNFINSVGGSELFLGENAGLNNSTLGLNTFIGNGAGQSNTIGGNNTFLGYNAGTNNISGSKCTFVGELAGYYANANYNTLVGSNAGHGIVSGTGNTFLGAQVGYWQPDTNSNTLMIDAYYNFYGDRGSSAAENAGCLIIGKGNTTPSLQTLSLNANTTVSQKLNVSGTTTLGTLNGILKGNSGIVTTATVSDFPSFSGLYLPLSGGTLSGPGNLNVSGVISSNYLTGLAFQAYNSSIGTNGQIGYALGKSYADNKSGFLYWIQGSTDALSTLNLETYSSHNPININSSLLTVNSGLNVSGTTTTNGYVNVHNTAGIGQWNNSNQYAQFSNIALFNETTSPTTYGILHKDSGDLYLNAAYTSAAVYVRNVNGGDLVNVGNISTTILNNLNVSGTTTTNGYVNVHNTAGIGQWNNSNQYAQFSNIALFNETTSPTTYGILHKDSGDLYLNAAYTSAAVYVRNVNGGDLVNVGNISTTISNNLNVSGTIQTNAASNANGTVIANTAAIGTVPGFSQAWFGYSGLNSTTTTAMAGFRALPTGGCYINSNGSDSYIRFRPNNDQTVLEVTPTNVNTNALTTISNNLNVSGTMLGRFASQTANTNPYNLGNISPYWVFANTNSVAINLPSSPSVGCAFCIINSDVFGVTVNSSTANISKYYNNHVSTVNLPIPSSNSSGAYNWFVYDGSTWWLAGSFDAGY